MASDLRVAPCSMKAARYACENWHYSGSVPMSPARAFGVWEGGGFIGAIIFARGANLNMAKSFGLLTHEAVELCRVALTDHEAPVSRIVAIASKLLFKANPGLRLVVSYADPSEGHHGGIYQAMGWTYIGRSASSFEYRLNGRRLQKRAYTGSNFGHGKQSLPVGAVKVAMPGKHIYIKTNKWPLPESVLRRVRPYPKRQPVEGSGDQPAAGGADPTLALQSSEEAP